MGVAVITSTCGAMVHAETVLLVDDGQGQRLELHRVFNQRVGAHDDLDRAVEQAGVDPLAFFRLGRAGQQRHRGARRGQELLHTVVVLVGQHLGRRHHAGLVAVVERHHGREHRHQRLAAAHVALQQAVHLLAAGHIRADLLEHALLRPGQGERQAFISLVEIGPDATEHHPAVGPHPDALLPQQRKLEVEQFLEFETALGPAQILQ